MYCVLFAVVCLLEIVLINVVVSAPGRTER